METANSFSQQQQQKQIQTLAPQQLASLSLLSLPIMELETRIAEEMSRNPVLEFDESEPESSDQDDFPVDDAFGEEKTDAGSEPADTNREDYEEYLDRMLDSGEPDADSDDAEKKRQFMFDSIAAETSLQEAMLEQLRFADVSPAVRSCAEYVIGSLDENGWFRGTLPDAAQSAGSSLQEAEQALTLVQSFDPPGIAARDLKECLLLQAARASGSPELETLIRDHLDELAHNKLPQIASAMKISMDELNQLIAELRGFTPHPGKVLDQHREPYIVPEVTVIPDGDEFRLIEKEPPYGRLTISKDYQKMLENPALAAGDKAYLRSMIDSGKSLIHSIEQRKSTILRIAELIVNAQYDFMKYGPRALKPMTMRQAADKLGLHETTVSRAVSGKYMLTPVGLFEFKYFFSGGFQSEEGEEVSARAIKNMIRDLVNAEDPAHPLSDSRLSSLLAEKGFEVARRTIAKYREELGISSSQLRKVY